MQANFKFQYITFTIYSYNAHTSKQFEGPIKFVKFFSRPPGSTGRLRRSLKLVFARYVKAKNLS